MFLSLKNFFRSLPLQIFMDSMFMNILNRKIAGISKIVKEKLSLFEWAYRIKTAKRRVLPDFIILGAQKAGTSTLTGLLKQHPSIFSPFLKEIHYFDGGMNPDQDYFKYDENWYKAHFPLKESSKKDQITFEASPFYLFHPLCPARIHQVLPNAKFIVLLRDPVERAISHYFHSARKGWEKRPFLQAIKEEDELIKKIFQNQDFQNPYFRVFSYKSRGLYAQQLSRYFQYFEQEQFLILKSEEFFTEPSKTLKQIFEFLNIESEFVPKNLKARNSGYNKEYEEIDLEAYQYLRKYFEEPNQKLSEMMGRDFNWK